MPTNFFEHQDVARRNTIRLGVLFVLAVLAITGLVHLVLAILFSMVTPGFRQLVLDPRLLASAVFATLVVVGGGAAYKVKQLAAGGGRFLATRLGGLRLYPNSSVASEQQLFNVVEEMAIASGIPTPRVYLLAEEQGINAFAAGFTPSDAVIGVTRGAVERLSRNELQGVIAHEFSHILNGDMRLGDVLLAVEIWSGGSLLVVIYGRWENPGAEAPRKEPP